MFRVLPVLTIGIWLSILSSEVRADPAAAEALFREGRTLLARGDVTAACAKLEASQALEASSGTLLNLAACRLKQGRTATAWAHFIAAERLARSQNRTEHADEARKRAADLEPELSTLTLRVSEPPPGLEVRRDGQIVPPGTFGTPVPLDPGTLWIEASAPGHEPFRLEVTLGVAGDRKVIDLPKLTRGRRTQGVAVPAKSGEPSSAVESSGPGLGPWIVGGAGAAALVAGSVFGVLAIQSNSTAIDQCEGRTNNCSVTARETAERRDQQALISTVGVGVGLVGIGVGALWWLGSRSPEADTAWFGDAELTSSGGMFRVRAGF